MSFVRDANITLSICLCRNCRAQRAFLRRAAAIAGELRDDDDGPERDSDSASSFQYGPSLGEFAGGGKG